MIEGSLSYVDSGYKQELLKMGNIIQRKKVHSCGAEDKGVRRKSISSNFVNDILLLK